MQQACHKELPVHRPSALSHNHRNTPSHENNHTMAEWCTQQYAINKPPMAPQLSDQPWTVVDPPYEYMKITSRLDYTFNSSGHLHFFSLRTIASHMYHLCLRNLQPRATQNRGTPAGSVPPALSGNLRNTSTQSEINDPRSKRRGLQGRRLSFAAANFASPLAQTSRFKPCDADTAKRRV